METTTIDIDLAKNVFQVHRVTKHGKIMLRKQLRRKAKNRCHQRMPSFASQRRAHVAWHEATSSSRATRQMQSPVESASALRSSDQAGDWSPSSPRGKCPLLEGSHWRCGQDRVLFGESVSWRSFCSALENGDPRPSQPLARTGGHRINADIRAFSWSLRWVSPGQSGGDG